jgi:hypothetical protein
MGGDHAEGLALISCLGQPEAPLVVYDTPHPARQVGPHEFFADVFRLPLYDDRA